MKKLLIFCIGSLLFATGMPLQAVNTIFCGEGYTACPDPLIHNRTCFFLHNSTLKFNCNLVPSEGVPAIDSTELTLQAPIEFACSNKPKVSLCYYRQTRNVLTGSVVTYGNTPPPA